MSTGKDLDRPGFEKAMRELGAIDRELRHAGGEYVDCYASPHMQLRWEGWQAARRAPSVAPAMLTRKEVDEIVYRLRQEGNDTTYAIVNAALALRANKEKT